MSADEKTEAVYAVVEERARVGAKGYTLSYVVKQSGVAEEEAAAVMDDLVEAGLVDKSWAYFCPWCGRTKAVFKDGEEPDCYEDEHGCDTCSETPETSLYITRDMASPQFTATDKLAAPEAVKVEPGVRTRRSPLAERLAEVG